MKKGYLSEHFAGVALKRLSKVEADETRSNQHEYNVTKEMRQFLGSPDGKQKLPCTFLYMSDEDDEAVIEEDFLTLYDARKNIPNRSEYRLYFRNTQVSQLAHPGDLLFIGKKRDGTLLVVIAADGSSTAHQISWLFGLTPDAFTGFSVRAELENEQDRIGFAAATILESIGVAVETQDETFLDRMLGCFPNGFPPSAQFSAFCRDTLDAVDPRDDPDAALMAWVEREEILFRTLERHIISERLSQGFTTENADDFIAFSLSVLNRRKSRAGLSLENHVGHVLQALGIRYTRGGTTEGKSRPDFLLPGQTEYHDPNFDHVRLSMLATKSSCKDRWRQVLAEADRIPQKHLLTLEAAISTNQTDEMQAKGLQLVVPRSLHPTFSPAQRDWLMPFRAFTELAIKRQQ